MMMRILAAAAAFTLASAGGAFASESTFSASLAQPVAKETKLIAGGAVWNCSGDSCVAGVITSRTASLRACQDLVKEVGPIAAYGGRTAYDADKLAKCNAVAKAPAAPAPSATAVAAN